LVFAAAEHVIQGQLYQRVLQRIPDEDLQKLAHPGLVVRRITENIIRKVLAVPCGLGKIDKRRAEELFSGLEKQVDLVIPEPDGALRHQQDIRRVMLKMLESEKPQQVKDIHERAFKFYKSEPGTAAQIETLYHALQLGKREKDIRALWIGEATESLLSSVDELPPSSQLLVYVLTKREPPPELRSLASLDQWERLVESRARRAVQYGDYPHVVQLLRERGDRTPGSALYAISAICSMQLRNYKVATEQLNKGIESAQSVNRIDRLVELWRLRGELLEEQGKYADADSSLAESQKLAIRMGSAILGLQIYAERARISDENNRDIPPVAELDEIVKATGDSDFASARSQLRGLFRICGGRSAQLLLKGLRVFTLQVVPELPDTWLDEAEKMAEFDRLNEFLQTLLEREPENPDIRAAVADSLEVALNPTRSRRKK
jgi:tetratricopeptide (TPR) repeat protein